MTTLLSATDVAIRRAKQAGTLRVTSEYNTRLGERYWAIRDEYGLIEVALSAGEAEQRVAAC